MCIKMLYEIIFYAIDVNIKMVKTWCFDFLTFFSVIFFFMNMHTKNEKIRRLRAIYLKNVHIFTSVHLKN